ncbi:hypothetical protein Clacol_002533 [Clathrus columnatus]|uniref:Uncharacterized protein n=1 Tax=Clathrus columnatus TaxID=1419009 RepID=A0AAV5A4E0_9AGAM|nr:hypothetical protein Clacol_002533 [Clathrus columnatus]
MDPVASSRLLQPSFPQQFIHVSRLSVANTSIIYHNSEALATCESGPFLTVELPTLNTVGWCEFKKCIINRINGRPVSFFEEWATGHPRIDPITSELIFFGSSFLPPYLRYSVVSADGVSYPSLLAAPISIKSPKLMHDFGVSLKHTIILDLPLSINPFNMLKGNPVVHFDPTVSSRFGIFPRYHPEQIRWFESDPCAIFHTANTWSDADDVDEFVNMLVCRFKSPKMLYVAGNISPPATMLHNDSDMCHLFYYRFNISSSNHSIPVCAFTLSAIPFEFPSISNIASMQDAKYIYGCTMREGSFDMSIGGAAKVDCLVRLDVKHLIQKGMKGDMDDKDKNIVDKRSVLEIITDSNGSNPDDSIKIFVFDEYHFAQECTFVPRKYPRHEADGYLLTYVFDERQLQSNGMACDTAVSELWIIDAANMVDIVGKIRLPQRGLYSRLYSWLTINDPTTLISTLRPPR